MRPYIKTSPTRIWRKKKKNKKLFNNKNIIYSVSIRTHHYCFICASKRYSDSQYINFIYSSHFFPIRRCRRCPYEKVKILLCRPIERLRNMKYKLLGKLEKFD